MNCPRCGKAALYQGHVIDYANGKEAKWLCPQCEIEFFSPEKKEDNGEDTSRMDS